MAAEHRTKSSLRFQAEPGPACPASFTLQRVSRPGTVAAFPPLPD
jgi:hypothetical protein